MSADIVAVEVLPKAQWITNYKDVPTDKWMDEGAPEVVPLGEEGEEIVPEHTNLMEQINTTTSQVTARVVGIIKKLPKTYGGSILGFD